MYSGGYVMVPGWFLALNPEPVEIKIYCVLATYGRFNTAAGCYEECRPALATLAADAGLSETHTKRGLAGLLAKGAIEKRQRVAEDGVTSLPSVYRVLFGSLTAPTMGEMRDGPPPSTDGPPGGAAGGPPGGPPVDPNLEPDIENQDTKNKSAARKRATPLPEDFTVTDAMRTWYAEKIGSAIDGLAQHEKFLDYYRANGRTHKDWPAAWRYWMRNALERSGTRRNTTGRQAAGYQSAAERSSARLQEERDLLLVAEEIVTREGGDPEKDHARVQEVYEQLRDAPSNGSASRTSSPYSGDSWIDGEVVPQREVTAGEDQ